MTGVHRRRGRPALSGRIGLARTLLVLYVVVVHGLPALHLAWHRNDHVHEVGGLRWLHGAAHAHAVGSAHPAPRPGPAPAPSSSDRLETAPTPSDGLGGPHLAAGPAHAQQTLLVPAAAPALPPAARGAALPLGSRVFRPSDLARRPRARAPPVPA